MALETEKNIEVVSAEDLQPNIDHLLYRLGLTANYRGYFYISRALMLCIEKGERLLLVTKWLYPEVAKRYGTNWKAVERNIRTASGVIWRENRPLLEELAGRTLEGQPRAAQLLAILAVAVKKERPQAKCSQPEDKRIV